MRFLTTLLTVSVSVRISTKRRPSKLFGEYCLKNSSILTGSESQSMIRFVPNGLKNNLHLLYFSEYYKERQKSSFIIQGRKYSSSALLNLVTGVYKLKVKKKKTE